jgi:uncharacterized protein YecT (DUF1311 family)
MKLLKFALILSAFTLITSKAQAQTQTQLNFLNNKYQACLDKGTNMLRCSNLYYKQMDSLLNVVYNRLRIPMNPSEKTLLKNEQLKWLKTREAYFKKVDKENGIGGKEYVGTDFQMIAIDEKAQFVRKRIEELMKRLKS